MMDYDFNKINCKSVKCPACGSSFDYREFIKSENIILQRYKAIISRLKMDYGEVFLNKDKVLLGEIKELENLYSILIKD